MRTVACVLVGFVVAGWAVAGRSATVQPSAPPRPYGVGPPDPAFAHAAGLSCAAASCHGGGQAGRVGSEHTTWAPDVLGTGPHDPHARAYRVLFNDDSKRIAANLKRGPAHRDALCLKCHATEGVTDDSALAEGVSCGACHGPAGKWLTVHYLPEWKALSNREKWDGFGFVPTKNLAARASNCASCHVGSSDREVNHDLIAAGHPRLAFEYTRFHFQPLYRKHWEERTPQPDFEVRAWVAGQAATVRAAVDVLKGRADRAAKRDPQTPWPEFAGYSCYACHQAVGTDAPKPGGVTANRAIGWPGWELWHASTVDVAAAHAPAMFPGASTPPLAELAALKKLMGQPFPRPMEVSRQAAAALAEVDAWLAALQAAEDQPTASRLSPDVSGRLARMLAAHTLSGNRPALRDTDWDFLASHYLGCAAMYHAAGGSAAKPDWTDPLREIGRALRFPPPGRVRFDSPAGFDRLKLDRVRDNFEKLRDTTDRVGVRR
jgi:hypothetical protein